MARVFWCASASQDCSGRDRHRPRDGKAMSVRTASDQSLTTFWSVTLEDLLLHLQATPEGLSAIGIYTTSSFL